MGPRNWAQFKGFILSSFLITCKAQCCWNLLSSAWKWGGLQLSLQSWASKFKQDTWPRFWVLKDCPRPQPSSCCHCWIIIPKERKFFSPLLVVQHKAGINTKHNILMSPLEHRWTSICLFLYRNLKRKNMWFQEEEGLLPGCLMVLHILSSQIGELFYRRGLGITCLRDFLLLYTGLLRRKGHYVVILASQVPCGVFLQSSPAKIEPSHFTLSLLAAFQFCVHFHCTHSVGPWSLNPCRSLNYREWPCKVKAGAAENREEEDIHLYCPFPSYSPPQLLQFLPTKLMTPEKITPEWGFCGGILGIEWWCTGYKCWEPFLTPLRYLRKGSSFLTLPTNNT